MEESKIELTTRGLGKNIKRKSGKRGRRMQMRRLWDDEGRILGWIHPVDLGLLLLLAVLIVRIFQLYLPQPAKEQKVEVGLSLLAPDIPPYIAASVSVGQDLFQDETGAYLGKINAKTVNAAEVTFAENGRLCIGNSPRNVDLRVRLRRSGRMVVIPARSGIYLGKLAVRIGDAFKVHTFYASFSGNIEAVRVYK